MKKRITVWLLVICLGCLPLTACQSKPQKFTAQSFDYFDTVTIVTGYGESRKAFDQITENIWAQFSQYHKLFDIYHSYEDMENLYTVNRVTNGTHSVVKVDSCIIDMLAYAKEMYYTTNGMVNVAMGSVLSLWHESRTLGESNPSQAKIPNMEQLKEASLHTNITDVILDETKQTVYLADPKMRLDVGAIAKGYAVEKVSEWLKQQGITGYVLNVGGTVSTIGSKPNDELWTIGIENPEETNGEYLAYLQLQNQRLVTSGSYQRYYVVEGKKYHHIIHPKTLMPAEGYLSVSVVCKNAALGDALSTALFCLSVKEGMELVEKTENVEVLWVDEEGNQTVSSGWNGFVKS